MSSIRRSVFLLLALLVAGCGWFSSKDVAPARIVLNPLDTSTHFARSVSLLEDINRIAAMNLATSFSWWDSTGRKRELNQNYGRVMAIFFWNNDQQWSSTTMKQLLQAKKVLKDSDVVYIGVLTGRGRDSSAVWRSQASMDSLGVDFQQIIGNSELSYSYGGINTMPTLFIVARNGKVHQTLEGQKSAAEIEAALRKTLSYAPMK